MSADMLAFDRLPSATRRMLTTLNFSWSAREVLSLHEMGWTTDRIEQRLREIETAKHRADADSGGVAL